MNIEDQKLYFIDSMPKGKEFYEWIFSLDEKKEQVTVEIYQSDDEFKSNDTYEVIPELLEILYKVATCGYGCKGGAHVIEYITGRGYNLGVSSLKLLRLGFYDEAISLIRSMSEIVNLFALFGVEPNSLPEWYDISEKERVKKFKPSEVRKRLSKTSLEPPISSDYYSKMCEVGVHVNPMTKPQGKNHIGKALIGGFVVKEQAIAVLNDLANNLTWLVIMSLRNTVDLSTFTQETTRLEPIYNKISTLNLETIDEYTVSKKNGV